MRIRTVLGEVLPVLGTVGLLGLWLFQQIGIENRNSELRKLAAARAVYQTYQSNNALFNAISEISEKDKKKSEQIRMFQTYNYELGLRAIEDALPATDKSDIPEAPVAIAPFADTENSMRTTQIRLEKLQLKLGERETRINSITEGAKSRYLYIYLLISFITVFGAVMKALDKLFPPES